MHRIKIVRCLSLLNSKTSDYVKIAYGQTDIRTFQNQTNYSIPYTLPDGYKPLWAWSYTENFVGAVYTQEISVSAVSAWTIDNCDNKTGFLKSMVLCIRN